MSYYNEQRPPKFFGGRFVHLTLLIDAIELGLTSDRDNTTPLELFLAGVRAWCASQKRSEQEISGTVDRSGAHGFLY